MDKKNKLTSKKKPGERATWIDGQEEFIPKGENVYLGTQFPDIGPKGFSNIKEIQETVEQIDEDYNHKVIDHTTALKRLYYLEGPILSKIHEGELAEERNKESAKAIIQNKINELKKMNN